MRREHRQARKARREIVRQNSSRVTITRQATTTDPLTGETVPDPDGTTTTHEIECRITHERAQVPTDESNPAGLSTNLQRMIMTDWQNVIKQNDTFAWDGRNWEVGPVDPIWQFGGVTGYQAPLQEA